MLINKKLEKELKYFAHLDLLRVFFVFIVLLHHFVSGDPLKFLPFGSTIAFVLSGFLLVSILLKAKDSTNSYWKVALVFLARRFIRTLPVYFLAVFVYYILNRHNFRDYIIYFITLTQNYLVAYNIDPSNKPIPFSISWSLAIQEQFYLILPIIIFIASNKYLKSFFLSLSIIGLLFRLYYFYAGYPFLYNHYTTECCLDCFGIGGIIAYYYIYENDTLKIVLKNRLILSIIILAYIFSMFGYSSFHKNTLDIKTNYLFNNLYRITERTFVSLLSIWFIAWGIFYPSALINKISSHKSIKYLSKISYSIYIWHFAVAWVVRYVILSINSTLDLNSWWIIVLIFVGTFFFASIVYELYEKPFQELKKYFKYE